MEQQVTVIETILKKVHDSQSNGKRAIYPDWLKRQVLKYIKDSNMTAAKFSEMSKISTANLTRWKREFSRKKITPKKVKEAASKKEAFVKTEMKESNKNPVVKIVYKEVTVLTLLSNLKQVVNELTS